MSSKLYSVEEASQVLSGTGTYLVAADEKVLKKLPHGNWMGGSIPYFMAENGGVVAQDKVFITELPDFAQIQSIELLSDSKIPATYTKIPENGFGIIILPASSPIHLAFATDAPFYKDFATKPLVGWISGVHLSELATTKPVVVNGKTGVFSSSEAVVMYVSLPKDRVCELNIVNIFEQGQGDKIIFSKNSFVVDEVQINGKTQNFAKYLIDNKIDLKNPLVANYAGAMVNVSFQAIDEKSQTVALYAPVFAGQEYRLASPINNYVDSFLKQMPKNAHQIAFSCNCILNFLYSELEGKKTGGVTGPITFGEVAYQLLNQTMVYLTIQKI